MRNALIRAFVREYSDAARRDPHGSDRDQGLVDCRRRLRIIYGALLDQLDCDGCADRITQKLLLEEASLQPLFRRDAQAAEDLVSLMTGGLGDLVTFICLQDKESSGEARTLRSLIVKLRDIART
jgi:hypothetical protein